MNWYRRPFRLTGERTLPINNVAALIDSKQ